MVIIGFTYNVGIVKVELSRVFLSILPKWWFLHE